MKTIRKIDLFTKNTGLMFLLSMILFSCQEPKEEEKFIGVQLWSVREDMKQDPEGTIKAVGDMGYKFIEAAGYGDGMFYNMEPVVFKQLVEDNGMTFLASHTGQDLPDEENWDETMAWWDEAIEAHAAAGVEYIVQPWMGNAGYESLEGLKRFCDYFNAVGEKCNAKGIRFGYHNHDGEFEELEGEVIYDFMLRNTDPEKVMFQMDLYWVVEGGADPVDYINNYPGRFELWHVKDEAEVGASGNIDFERIFNYADQSGMEYIIVEVEKYNYEPLESIKVSLEYLQNADFVKTK
ncbi:MAG: sugar phosphate isomerase/epimerase family protein [Bacteroidales bacterium]